MATNKRTRQLERPEALADNGQAVRIRGPYEALRVPSPTLGESMTDTSQGNDTDINNIIARFDRTGQLPGNPGQGQFVDVAGLNRDLTELLELQREALQELSDLEQQIEENQQKVQEIQEDLPQTQETTEDNQ